MRILHVIPGLTHERGGPSVVLEALVRHQIDTGHEVGVLTTDQGARHGEHPVELHSAAKVERLPVWGPDRLAYARGLAPRLRSKIHEVDIIHIHSIFTYPVHVALREAKAARVPAILRPCGLLHRYSLQRSRWQKRLYLSRWGGLIQSACAAWHYTSDAEASESWPFDTSPRFVLANGVEPCDFDWNREGALKFVRERIPELNDSPYVLFLGRLHPKKRLDLLLEAFLGGAPAHFKLLVAGHDECRLWSRLAADLQSEQAKRVLYLGPVSGKLKTSLLAGASLFALPSEHENFGVAVLEALASGTPALVSPAVDLAHEMTAQDVGVVSSVERTLWQGQIAALLSNEDRLRIMGQRAKSWAAERYQWSAISRALLQHYKMVIERRRLNGGH